ncbi:gliding motility lipoprotein GldH [Flavobacterium alkalisoli]|uniref:gliding motility lipoprotein GldH n=1 Tax=Flavobacterium alkalisoli TaxID=2602769 RepID=UPI003A8DC832
MLIRNSLLAIGLLFLTASCDKKRVFDDYKAIKGTWNKDSIVSFQFEQNDTVTPYNMFLNIRNNNDYPFNNIFLIVNLEQPNGVTVTDTLEYMMANPDGSLLGKGFSDVKESKLWYKENERFPKAGNYTVSIQQAVRKSGDIPGVEELNGVTEVGFRIESVESKE